MRSCQLPGWKEPGSTRVRCLRPGASLLAIKKPVGKTKEELALEKKRELEKRLQDVSGQLNSTKKPPKKGEYLYTTASPLHSANLTALSSQMEIELTHL